MTCIIIIIFYNFFFILQQFDNLNYVDPFIEKIEKCATSLSKFKQKPLQRTIRIIAEAKKLSNSWETIIWPEIQKNKIYQNLDKKFPWFDVAARLLSVNFIDENFIAKLLDPAYLSKIFDSKPERSNWLSFWNVAQFSILNKHLFSNEIDLTHTNIYMKNAIILKRMDGNCSIQKLIETEFGLDYVITKIISKHGHFIQHLLQYDVNKDRFVPFNNVERDSNEEFIELETLPIENNDIKL